MATMLTEIEDFLVRHDIAPATFGALALGDRHLVQNLRLGREVRSKTAEKIRAFMARYEADASIGNAHARRRRKRSEEVTV